MMDKNFASRINMRVKSLIDIRQKHPWVDQKFHQGYSEIEHIQLWQELGYSIQQQFYVRCSTFSQLIRYFVKT